MKALTAISRSQERIVAATAVILFVVFSLTLPKFATSDNLIVLLRNVSVLGILCLGMGVVVIARGADLSIVAIMVISVAWFLSLAGNGTPIWMAFGLALGLALLFGLLNGFLIAYAEVSPLFVTLAMGTFVFGFGRSYLLDQDLIRIPPQLDWFAALGRLRPLGIPIEIVVFCVASILMFLVLRYTRIGYYLYLVGDNPQAARITGVPTRPLIVMQYVFSAAVAFLAGAITAAGLQSVNTRMANSTLLYDVLLVIVIGGIALSGGKGGVRNIIVGTLLIGILLNGMTILNISNSMQNLLKAVVLLSAIIVDSIVNPRDEQTEQQGDI